MPAMHDAGIPPRSRVTSGPERLWFATVPAEELSASRQSATIAKSCARPSQWRMLQVRCKCLAELDSVFCGRRGHTDVRFDGRAAILRDQRTASDQPNLSWLPGQSRT